MVVGEWWLVNGEWWLVNGEWWLVNKQVVELFCAQNGWQFEIIDDLGN
jgi:hypothetical protein